MHRPQAAFGQSEFHPFAVFEFRLAAAMSQESEPPPKSPETRKRTWVAVTGDFIRSKAALSEGDDGTCRDRFRVVAARFLRSVYLANFIVIVVFVDAYCTCRDIDSRAAQLETPIGFILLSDMCLLLYSAELILQVYVKGLRFLQDWMVMLDTLVVLCGYVEMLLLDRADLGIHINVTRAFRLVRIFRLIRVLRKIRTLRELHKLVTMMATCLKTLAWSFLLCFLVMTVWAMLMVEMVQPLVLQMQEEIGTFDGCEQCLRALSSVMHANLLLFKTVIAGDGWGELAVPVIEEYPATAFIFVGALLTLVFGVLNLIVAVVVDTFADARQNDVFSLAEEMEDDIEVDKKTLTKLFQRIDADGSGQLTLEELIEGARNDAAFQSRLRVMDIDENDLQQLFQMIDVDGSGTIEAAEFIGPLSRWVHDSKTAPRFIKYNMLQTMHLQEDLYDLSTECFKHLSERVEVLANEFHAFKQVPVPQSPSVMSDERVAQKHEEKDAEGIASRTVSLGGIGQMVDFIEDKVMNELGEFLEQPQASLDAQKLQELLGMAFSLPQKVKTNQRLGSFRGTESPPAAIFGLEFVYSI